MILAIDTSMGTSVALVGEDGVLLAEQHDAGTRGHAELIGRFLDAVFRSTGGFAGNAQPDGAEPRNAEALTGVAIGMGPGPYTGLRVGIAAARAFAVGRGVPVLPVASHDAIREELGLGSDVPVATPAGRRGHYVSSGGRLELTHDEPDTEIRPTEVSSAALARVALRQRRSGVVGPAEPLYLREPDVAPPGPRKRVGA